MNLFSMFSNKNDIILLQKMKDYLTDFIEKYSINNPNEIENLSEIFTNAKAMLNAMTPNELKEGMQDNGVSAECGVLNILQNFAMSEINNDSLKDVMLGETDSSAYNLYMAINEEKFKNKYISEEQYEDNKRLGDCLKFGINPHFFI